VNESSPGQVGNKPSRNFLLSWAIVAIVIAAGIGATALLLSIAMREEQHPSPSSKNAASTSSSDIATRPSDRVPTGVGYSASNVVTILLGQEEVDSGLSHLADWRDGQTTIENLDGVRCRYLNHRARGQRGGAYFYFVIDPTFKTVETKAVRVEFEYFTSTPVMFKVQYDGMEGEQHRSYKPAGPAMPIPGSNVWRTATFELIEPVFQNSQNGGADFRLDVNPPELYLRRVSLTRGDALLSPPQLGR
jgi:hypothetical protein